MSCTTSRCPTLRKGGHCCQLQHRHCFSASWARAVAGQTDLDGVQATPLQRLLQPPWPPGHPGSVAPFLPHGTDPGWKRFPNPSTHPACVGAETKHPHGLQQLNPGRNMRAAVSCGSHRAQLSLWGFGVYQHCPLTFLLNSFHQLHQERRSNLGRAELLLQIRQRRPWERGKERRAQH